MCQPVARIFRHLSAMEWNFALSMMGSHWVLSKQVTCSVLCFEKIVLDALFRIEGALEAERT